MNKLNITLTLLIGFLLLSSFSGFSQGKKEYFEVYKASGDSCLAMSNFYGAHQEYEKALNYKKNTDVAFKCAEACRSYQNYPDAEKYYKLTIAADSVSYKLASFWLAEMLKYQGKYGEAAKAFAMYYNANKRLTDYYTKKAKAESEVCKNKISTIPEYKNIRITRIDDKKINSMYAEYSPCKYNDSTLFFGGVRPIDVVKADTNYKFNNYLNKISKAVYKDSAWQSVTEVVTLNDPIAHVGNLTFSGSGKTAYFTKCIAYNCSIYKASYNKKTQAFSDVQKLSNVINAPGSSNTTPHLASTPYGEYLIFASNRKGTKGKMDLWISRLNENGNFEKAINCGPNINTMGDEVTPFYDVRESTLFFSSEWHTSLGGFDVFSSNGNMKTQKWTPVKNIGKPVNSSYNDLYYAYAQDSLKAYWVSNRTESNRLISKAYSNDIYYHSLVSKSIARITDLVPIFLYFDNDYPDPRSRDTVTNKEYEQLYRDFVAKKSEYIEEYTKNSKNQRYDFDFQNLETFFTDLKKEYDKLFLFAELMEVILADGQDIVVIFKGYASPVGNTEYNEIVAKKRISCIQNFFNEFHGGVLNKYLNNEPKTGAGSLKFGHEPFGEIKAEDTFYTSGGDEVSAISDRKQKWMSVYSPSAAYQRKIEIIAVSIDYEEELNQEISREKNVQKKMVEDDGTSIYEMRARNTQNPIMTIVQAGTTDTIQTNVDETIQDSISVNSSDSVSTQIEIREPSQTNDVEEKVIPAQTVQEAAPQTEAPTQQPATAPVEQSTTPAPINETQNSDEYDDEESEISEPTVKPTVVEAPIQPAIDSSVTPKVQEPEPIVEEPSLQEQTQEVETPSPVEPSVEVNKPAEPEKIEEAPIEAEDVQAEDTEPVEETVQEKPAEQKTVEPAPVEKSEEKVQPETPSTSDDEEYDDSE